MNLRVGKVQVTLTIVRGVLNIPCSRKVPEDLQSLGLCTVSAPNSELNKEDLGEFQLLLIQMTRKTLSFEFQPLVALYPFEQIL
jgi:hypothetical protein